MSKNAINPVVTTPSAYALMLGQLISIASDDIHLVLHSVWTWLIRASLIEHYKARKLHLLIWLQLITYPNCMY